MGKNWDDFKDRVGRKTAGVAMIIIDLAILLVLTGLMILADRGGEWIVADLGEGYLFTRITIIVVAGLFNLTAIAVVLGWGQTILEVGKLASALAGAPVE